jgi:hypothetical protein
MWQGIRRTALWGALALSGVAALAPAAGAAITPTISLDQSAGKTAGSTANLGVDLQFAPTGSDSPQHMTLNLPPGLLANASINGGACLKTVDLDDTACQVGSGTVTAYAFGTVPVPANVTFDLVPPPAAGDLAGLAVNSNGTQIGATADIKVRPSGDPDGVGVTIQFLLPNTLYGTPISIHEISSTFDGLRYPTTCPTTPQSFTVSADSYGDATVHTVSAPLAVTGCSSLAYSPAFAVTATRDSADSKVTVVTQVTQSATEAPSRSVALALPDAQLQPNTAALSKLCQNLSSGTCSPVGSVTASSPDYPKALTGQAYLTSSGSQLTLTLVFPPPFPLTLVGTVDLLHNVTTFTGLPDIPLTDLDVTLDSGPSALFLTNCQAPTGTATATLTDQNGDKTATVPGKFTISGCPASSSGGGGSGPGGGSPAGGRGVGAPTASGLTTGHPSLRFKLKVAKGAAKLRALTIELPRGLSIIAHRAGRTLTIKGVRLTGGAIRSLSLSHGHLTITLKRAVSSVTVTLTGAALRESAALRAKAKAHKLKRLALTVIAQNTKGRRTTIHVQVTHLGV